MKFVCDNCQAKYQIGDDKVAGKTVRMKCRKCGYNIKVSPSGAAESSPATSVPSADAPSIGGDAPASLAPASLVASRDDAPAPAAAGASGTWSEDDESTSIMSVSVRDAVAAATKAPRPTTPATPAPRPASPPRPVTGDRPRTITSTGTPRPQAAPVRHSTGSMQAVRPATRTASGQLAAVKAEPTPDVEWYVGIAGTPIGPVGVSVIRERALAREVDGDSLVWREGMPEWRPLRTIPELLEVVNGTAARKSAPPPPLAATPMTMGETPKPPAPLAAVASLAAAAPAAAPATSTPAAMGETPKPPAQPSPVAATPAPAPLAVIADPLAAKPATNGKANGVHVEALVAPAPAAAPAPDAPAPVAPAPAPKPAPKDDLASLEESLIPRRRGGVNPMAYAFVAAAAVFGGVAAWVLLHPQQPQVIVVHDQAAVQQPNAAPNAAPPPPPKLDDTAQVNAGEPSATPGGQAHPSFGGARPRGTASASPTGTPAAPIDTSSFVNTVPGPAATAPSQGASTAGQLTQSDIQAVVNQNHAIIKRKCWQPALEARPPNAPSSARVVGSLVIGASGAVESANASGADSYPGLASCIAARMKNWKFPPSGGTTPVQVPFVFAGQ